MVELFDKVKWMEKYNKKEIIKMMKLHVNPEWKGGNKTQTIIEYKTKKHSNPKVIYNRIHRIGHEREGTNMSKHPAVIDDIKYSWRELKKMKKEMLIFLAFRLGIEEEE